MDTRKKLEWSDKYSVGVEEIDSQHKMLFEAINELIAALGINLSKEGLNSIIKQIIDYKHLHFSTEEKYFKEFNYEKTEDHINKHNLFNKKLKEIQDKNGDDVLVFAFELIDFLEDWLIVHLMTADQEYKACFKEHGLK